MREVSVVLVDIEADQLPNRGSRVERIQRQPLVLKHPPPGLDQRVRERDSRLGTNAVQQPGLDELVDCRVEVLDTTVDQHQGRARGHALACVEQELCGNAGMEGPGNIPCENPSGKVVYDRVEVSSTAIEQSDQCRVDMPDLVGT